MTRKCFPIITRYFFFVMSHLDISSDRVFSIFQAVCTLIEPAVEAGRVSEFLWDHIVNDLGTISEGMSQDDTMLLIHRIIIGLGTEQVTSSVDSERGNIIRNTGRVSFGNVYSPWT